MSPICTNLLILFQNKDISLDQPKTKDGYHDML